MSKRIFSTIFLSVLLSLTSSFYAQNNHALPDKDLYFIDDFTKDSIGGYPQHWNGNAEAAVVAPKTYTGRWMKLHSQGTYVPTLKKSLPESFAVEFDYIYEVNGSGNNSTELTFFSRQNQTPLDAGFPGQQGVKIYLGDFLVSYMCYTNSDILDKTAGENRSVAIEQHQITKVRVEIRKEIVTLLLNGNMVLKIQRSKSHQSHLNTFRLNLWGSVAEPLIGNFRISSI